MRVVFVIILALALGACERKSGPDPAPVSGVAELKGPTGDVKARRAKTLVWTAAAEGLSLGNYDAVMTGAQSHAVLLFKDAYQLNMADNTMVIVLDREKRHDLDKTVVALPSGTIDGKVDGQAATGVELVVRTRRGWIRASRDKATGRAARFQATVTSEGALKVESRAGEVVVATQGSERVVPQGEAFTIETTADAGAGTSATAEDFAVLPQAVAKVEDKPSFTLQRPHQKQVVTGDAVEVSGKILGPLTVYLNGVQLQPGNGGAFATQVSVNPGINLLTFQVVDLQTKRVRYETREVVRKSSDAPKK